MHYVTSDTHFGHGNIIKYCHRPFLAPVDKEEFDRLGGVWNNGDWKGDSASKWRISPDSIKMMDDHLISQINKHVRETDVLWFLGDWCFARKDVYFETAKRYRERIACKTINFIYGNHDHGRIAELFNESYRLHSLYVDGRFFVLCHYAMAIWEDSHRGSICLYGHSHAGVEDYLNKAMPGRKSMDVGVDNAAKVLGEYRPFSFQEIIKIMETNPGFLAKKENEPREETLI